MKKSREKYWSECSDEEKAAVEDWDRRRKQNKEDYKNEVITHRQFIRRLGKLSKELNLIEKKYEDAEISDKKQKKLF